MSEAQARSAGPWSRVYDKTGLEELVARPARGRRRDRLHRLDRGPDRRGGRAGDAGRGAHRLPRVPGRPGEDAAPAGARRAAGRPPAARARPRSWTSSGSSRSTCWCRTSTRSARRWPPAPAPRSASSRSTSAARRWSGRRRRTTRASPWSTDPARYGEVLAAVRAGGFTLAAARAGWPRRRSCTPRPTTSRSPPGWATCWPRPTTAPASRPGSAPPGTAPRCCATARTRTSGPRSTGSWRPGLAHAEQLHGKEMSYNNYVDTDAALARRARLRRSPRWRSSSTPTRAGSPSPATSRRRTRTRARLRPGVGVRRRDRRQPAVTAAMAEQVAEVFTEVVAAPGSTRRRWRCSRSKKNLRLLQVRVGRPARGGGVPADQRRAAGADGGPGGRRARRRRRRPVGVAAGRRRPRRTRPRWPTCAFAWRAVRAVRSNAILLARRRRQRRHRDGPGEPGGLVPAGGGAGRAPTGPSGAVAASDAFFPFADGLQVLLDAGVRAVVQPGGSVRDGEVVAAAAARRAPRCT